MLFWQTETGLKIKGSVWFSPLTCSPWGAEEKAAATMEPKVICVLLVVFLLALSTQAQGETETCTVAPKHRTNCGFPGITPSQCAKRSCCFDDAIRGYPWCFYPLKVDNVQEEECEF
ncbi:trefoil factor 1 [Artibeus jamaicensis]|uniref:trefoil factor 1 n=1 Tax=Artibeus jamaicensis TaxID=9417 RepID=UPI00235A5455|nr:trefoil factor 1 [Artibeus jamaicensis]